MLRRTILRLLATILLVGHLAPARLAAQPAADLQAPTRLYPPPQVYSLLRLPGELVTAHYTPGSLARAARLQLRLEDALRSLERWTNAKLRISLYVLSRQDWQDSRYGLAYGLPLRVGASSLAVPAEGDDGTARLWAETMGGLLPRVTEIQLRGTPQEAATMVLADLLAQVLVSEILVDDLALGGDQPWIRGFVTQVAAVEYHQRREPDRLSDLKAMYGLLLRERGPKAMSARDYRPDLGLRDWLWFQAQFHFGAQTLLEQEGKGALNRLKKLRKKDGVLRAERIFSEFEGIEAWFRRSFSAVSLRTGG